MRFAEDWLTVVGTALALTRGKSASVSQSSAPETPADDNSAYSVSIAWTVRFRTFVPDKMRHIATMDVPRPTIVIVEDEEAISLFWGDCLREAGFDVQVFSDATGVLEFLDGSAHSRTHIAAAIVDIGLPGVQGDELARLCRDHRPKLPIIFATGYDERRFAGAIATDPLLSILGKPFDTPRLLMRLEQFGVYAPLSH